MELGNDLVSKNSCYDLSSNPQDPHISQAWLHWGQRQASPSSSLGQPAYRKQQASGWVRDLVSKKKSLIVAINKGRHPMSSSDPHLCAHLHTPVHTYHTAHMGDGEKGGREGGRCFGVFPLVKTIKQFYTTIGSTKGAWSVQLFMPRDFSSHK